MLVHAQAPVAQLDRALPSEGRGQRFESSRVHQYFQSVTQSVSESISDEFRILSGFDPLLWSYSRSQSNLVAQIFSPGKKEKTAVRAGTHNDGIQSFPTLTPYHDQVAASMRIGADG